MRLEDRTVVAIDTAIREWLGDTVRDINIEADETGDEFQIRIKIMIAEDVDPAIMAKRFFGLTRRVRDAMGSEFEEVFPILRPVASAHA